MEESWLKDPQGPPEGSPVDGAAEGGWPGGFLIWPRPCQCLAVLSCHVLSCHVLRRMVRPLPCIEGCSWALVTLLAGCQPRAFRHVGVCVCTVCSLFVLQRFYQH